MKARLPQPSHYSYQVHRREVMRQVILPVVLATLAMIAMAAVVYQSTLHGGGDVGRWAAVSTMWILLPVLIGGVIVLVILIALIYLLALVLGYLPQYSAIAQDYVFKARGYVLRALEMLRRPITLLTGLLENLREYMGRL